MGLNPFNIREAGQTAARGALAADHQSQSLQHQGSRSDARIRKDPDFRRSLNPFNIREAGQTRCRGQCLGLLVSIPSTSGKPVRHHASIYRNHELVSIPSTSGKPVRHISQEVPANRQRLNPFNIREAGQTGTRYRIRCYGDVSIPSTSGKPVRRCLEDYFPGRRVSIPSTSGKPVRHRTRLPAGTRCLNPFNIREAGQTKRAT